MVGMGRRLGAEAIGTFWLVLGGCGAAVLAAGFPRFGIGFVGVAFAFGLTVVTMAYAVGHVSGGHFNPAVTLGLWLGRRHPAREVLPYVVVQVLAAIAACAVLLVIARGQAGFDVQESGFAVNGYDELSPGGYDLTAALVTELVMTGAFLMVILGVTDRRAPKGFGPLAIGLGLTLIHLISIPVTNTSVNPARSTGPALFYGDQALSQLWLFWLAPLVGAAVVGVLYRYVTGETGDEPVAETAQDVEAAEVSAGEVPGPPAPRRSGGRRARRSPSP